MQFCSLCTFRRSGELSSWLAGLAALLFVGVASIFAFYFVFSRSMSPDEGYLMITVQSFIEGNALYNTVFTHYGPFYYAYEWVVHALLSVPLTHDATRMLCMFHWLMAALLLGIAGGIIMRSRLGGLFVFTEAVIHLKSLANEPGHPQELIVVLLAMGVLAATQSAERKGVLSILACLTAFLAFTKINIGVFFGLALLLALRCQARDRYARGAWRWGLASGCALLPFLLMRPHLAAEWCRNYSIVAGGAIFTVLLVAHKTYSEIPQCISTSVESLHLREGDEGPCPSQLAFTWRSLVTMTFFLLGTSFLICAIPLLTGTSLRGLIAGLLLTPLKMPGVALLPLPLANAVLVNAMAAMAMGIMVSVNPRGARMGCVVTILKLVYALAGSLCLLGDVKAQLGYLLPWVWLALIPVGEESEAHPGGQFSRVFLCLAATWQSLQAYPIGGTQVTTATILLVPAYPLCLRDFIHAIVRAPEKLLGRKCKPWRDEFHESLTLPIRALAVVGLLYFFVNVRGELAKVRQEYAGLPSLGLPGSRYVHMDVESTEMYRALTKYLEVECDTFVTYPGINSLYFWTGKRPPTHLNSTGWGPLSHAQQGQILTALRQARRPMLVVVAAAARDWPNYAPPPISPLAHCVLEDCIEVKRIGRFIIFIPKPLKTPRAPEAPIRAAGHDPDCKRDC